MIRDELEYWNKSLSGEFGQINGVPQTIIDLAVLDGVQLELKGVLGNYMVAEYRPAKSSAIIEVKIDGIAAGSTSVEFVRLDLPEGKQRLEALARQVTGAQECTIDLAEIPQNETVTTLLVAEPDFEPVLLSA